MPHRTRSKTASSCRLVTGTSMRSRSDTCRLRLADDQDGTPRVVEHLSRDAAEQRARNSPQATRADHDQVGVDLVRVVDDLPGGGTDEEPPQSGDASLLGKRQRIIEGLSI